MRSLKQKGFTIIELIAVIVIMGVLATATTQYITFGAQIYVEGSERQKVLSQSRFLIERLTRELRAAIPNSVRVYANSACLGFVPIKASGAYKTIGTTNPVPILPNSSFGQIEVVSWDANYQVNDRMYIYATSLTDIYAEDNANEDNFAVIENVTANPAAPNYRFQLFQITGQEDVFKDASPIARYFTADHTVSYCFVDLDDDGVFDVYRFVENSFSLTDTVPNTAFGVLMAEGLTNNPAVRPPFRITDLAQVRNSVVNLYLQFDANKGENMFYNHEVHIPNVP